MKSAFTALGILFFSFTTTVNAESIIGASAENGSVRVTQHCIDRLDWFTKDQTVAVAQSLKALFGADFIDVNRLDEETWYGSRDPSNGLKLEFVLKNGNQYTSVLCEKVFAEGFANAFGTQHWDWYTLNFNSANCSFYSGDGKRLTYTPLLDKLKDVNALKVCQMNAVRDAHENSWHIIENAAWSTHCSADLVK